MKHDFKAALEQVDRYLADGLRPDLGFNWGTVLAALRAAVARQEAEEAVERGEAVRLRGEVRESTIEPHFFFRDYEPRDSGRPVALFSVIVPIPKPVEIEAEVTDADQA